MVDFSPELLCVVGYAVGTSSIHFALPEAIVIATKKVCFELGRYAIMRLCDCNVVKNTSQALKKFQSYKMVAHCRNPDSKPCISTYEERQNAPLLFIITSGTNVALILGIQVSLRRRKIHFCCGVQVSSKGLPQLKSTKNTNIRWPVTFFLSF